MSFSLHLRNPAPSIREATSKNLEAKLFPPVMSFQRPLLTKCNITLCQAVKGDIFVKGPDPSLQTRQNEWIWSKEIIN